MTTTKKRNKKSSHQPLLYNQEAFTNGKEKRKEKNITVCRLLYMITYDNSNSEEKFRKINQANLVPCLENVG